MDWVWQLPQNILGLGYRIVLYKDISAKLTSPKENYIVYLKETPNGVTLGKYIFVHRRYNNLSYVVRHESGHVKQSRILGPLYLLVIGLPSIIWAASHKYIAPDKSYYWLYTESWANKLAGID